MAVTLSRTIRLYKAFAGRFGLTAFRCLLCGDSLPASRLPICANCAADLPRNPIACTRCAAPLAMTGTCGRCQRTPLQITECRAAFAYRHPIAQLVHAAKFRGDLVALRLLSGLFAEHAAGEVPQPRPHALIPVPLHPARLRRRGYNQSCVIARAIARSTGIPCNDDLCIRVRATPPQLSLSRRERARNVAAAFETTGTCDDAYLVIVDDVATTGYTLDALAGVLRRAGAARVDAWVCARASI